MLPFKRAVRQTKLGKTDEPVLLSTPVCESGRRFAGQATALDERDGRHIYPILDHAGAEAGYDVALGRLADYPPALVGKARCRLAAGDPASAVSLLERAHSLAPLTDTAALLAQARAAG